MTETSRPSGIANLPAELVIHILSYLEPVDLAQVAQTCRAFYEQSYDDALWQPLLSSKSSTSIKRPYPFDSFRELFVAHHPHWFLLKHRIWFGDGPPYGKLLLTRYEPNTGNIVAHTVLGTKANPHVQTWEKDRRVFIHSFDPQVSLHLRRQELRLTTKDYETTSNSDQERTKPIQRQKSWYGKERLMDTMNEAGLYSSFMLCRAMPESAISESTHLWPPLRIPAVTRTRNLSGDDFNSLGHRPNALAQISENNFRIRKWAEYTGRTGTPNSVPFTSPNGLAAAIEGVRQSLAVRWRAGMDGLLSIRMPEDVATYASLPEISYTPTAKKPWQGIWCGDYSGHGVEFLLIHQPDQENERPLPDGFHWLMPWFSGNRRGPANSASAQEQTSSQTENTDAGSATHVARYPTDHEQPPTGRLEAIKLTGDPNIPRGEHTFIAPDIGPGGLIRIADEEIFRGARVVRSAGHVAHRNFMNDHYTPSHLIMISHDRLAQYWEEMGHISFYQRVDLDALLEYTPPAPVDVPKAGSSNGNVSAPLPSFGWDTDEEEDDD